MLQPAAVLATGAAARRAAEWRLESNGVVRSCLRRPQSGSVRAQHAAVASGAQTVLQFAAKLRYRALATPCIPACANAAQTAGCVCSAPCTHTDFTHSPSPVATKAVLRAAPRLVLSRALPRRRARWHADARPCCADRTQKCGLAPARPPHLQARSVHGSISDAHHERVFRAAAEAWWSVLPAGDALSQVRVPPAQSDDSSAHVTGRRRRATTRPMPRCRRCRHRRAACAAACVHAGRASLCWNVDWNNT